MFSGKLSQSAGPDTEKACLPQPSLRHWSADRRLRFDEYGVTRSLSIWVQARARQKTQVLVIYTGHASEPEASAT